MSKVKFLDCAELTGTGCKQYSGKKYYVSTGAVKVDMIDFENTELVSYEDKPSRANLSVLPGTVMFAKMKGTRKTLLVDSKSTDYVYSTGFAAVKPVTEIITPECLYYLVMSEPFLRQKDQHSTGATQKAITQQGLGKITVNIPPLNEQADIVQNLNIMLDAISTKERERILLDELLEARFVEMFGDPVNNTKKWPKKPLKEECDVITGNTPSRKVSTYYGDYIEWIKSDNINTPSDVLTVAEEGLSIEGLKVGRSVEAGAILMTCIAGSVSCIGNIAIADRKVSFNQQINAIVPKNNDTWYMYTMLKLSKEYIQAPINKALKGILSKGQLSDMMFIFPPYEMQKAFGAWAEELSRAKQILENQIIGLRELLDSKMNEYFS